MLKLVLKMPQETDAELLMTTALALADFKRNHPYKFNRHYDGTLPDYGAMDLVAFEPELVWRGNVREHQVDADLIDPFLMETLRELKKIVRFEFSFEERGKLSVRATA